MKSLIALKLRLSVDTHEIRVYCLFKFSWVFVCLSSREKGMKNSGMNGDLNPDLCDAGVVLHKLSYWANWEQVTVWVDYKPVDAEIDDDNTGIFSTYLNCRYKE